MDSPLQIIQALGRTAQLTWSLLSARYTRTPTSIDRGTAKRRLKRHRPSRQRTPSPTRLQFHQRFPEEIIIHILDELCVRDILSVGSVSRLKVHNACALLIGTPDEAQTCKRLHSITSTLLSQYLSDLSCLGLGFNLYCTLPFRIARGTSTSRSSAWASLKPLASATARVLPFDPANHSLFYITDKGYLCVKERARDRLRLAWKKFKRVPAGNDEFEAHEDNDNDDANGEEGIAVDSLVMDGSGSRELRGQVFLDCVDLYSDLLVCLQRRNVADALHEFDEPEDNEFPPTIPPGSPFIRFLRMSGGEPHPDAAFPLLPLTSLSSSILRNIVTFDSSLHGLKTCGSTCGFLQFANRVDFIYVDWRKGIGPLRMSNVGGSKRRTLDFFFLDPSRVCFIVSQRIPSTFDRLELHVYELDFRTSKRSGGHRRSAASSNVSASSGSDTDSDDDRHKDPDEINMRSKSSRARHMRIARLALPRQSRPVACNITTDAEPSPQPFTRRPYRSSKSTAKTASRFSMDESESVEKDPEAIHAQESLSTADASYEYPDPDGGVAFAVFDHPTSTEMAPFELGVIFSLAGLRRVIKQIEDDRFSESGSRVKGWSQPLPWDEWGPPVSRAVPIPISRCFYAPPICGRLALAPILPTPTPPGAMPGTPPIPTRASIRIRDFNPGRIKWARDILASGGQLPAGARLVEGESELRTVIFPWGFKTALPFYEVKIDRDVNGEEGVDVKFMELARGWLLIANSSFPELDVDDVFTIHNFL